MKFDSSNNKIIKIFIYKSGSFHHINPFVSNESHIKKQYVIPSVKNIHCLNYISIEICLRDNIFFRIVEILFERSNIPKTTRRLRSNLLSKEIKRVITWN